MEVCINIFLGFFKFSHIFLHCTSTQHIRYLIRFVCKCEHAFVCAIGNARGQFILVRSNSGELWKIFWRSWHESPFDCNLVSNVCVSCICYLDSLQTSKQMNKTAIIITDWIGCVCACVCCSMGFIGLHFGVYAWLLLHLSLKTGNSS